jgi:hypothetical protein
MQMLYDQSKVVQQCTSKYQCILAMKHAAEKADDYNKLWSEYTAVVPKGENYEAEAKSFSIGLLPAEGESLARQEGAKLTFTPSDILKTKKGSVSDISTRADSDSDDASSSCVSSLGEAPDKDEAEMMLKIEQARGVAMVYSRCQRPGLVHIRDPDRDTLWGRKARCGSLIHIKNAELTSAWEASRDMGALDWCPKCRLVWPKGLSDVVEP